MRIRTFLLCNLAAACIIFFRQPDAFLRPQFWAEDGKVWFADAYNLGALRSLVRPQDGYFQTVSRITADVSLAVPIERAPLIFAIGALLLQMTPFALLLSRRLQLLIPNYRTRLILATLYLLLPNTTELHGNITNGQWYLALAACLIVASDNDGSGFWNVCDLILLVLAGLSGPFALLLSPIALAQWFYTRQKQALRRLLVLVTTALLQAIAILFVSHAGRLAHVPVVTIRLLSAVVLRQVLVSSLIGARGYLWLIGNVPNYIMLVSALGMFVSSLVIYAVLKGPLGLRLFVAFAGLVLAVSFLSPTGDFTTYSALKLLSRSTDGVRYWLIPISAVFACLVWDLSSSNHKLVKYLAGICLLVAVVGMVVDFQHPTYVDYNFSDRVRELEHLSPGQTLSFPINPPGWTMKLSKP
jgi:hypothetical protein